MMLKRMVLPRLKEVEGLHQAQVQDQEVDLDPRKGVKDARYQDQTQDPRKCQTRKGGNLDPIPDQEIKG